ncbi:MAG: FxsA family protein [Polyangiales bacterium]
MLVLFLLFTLVPLVELALLIKLGAFWGLGPTVALVLVTGVLGAAFAKREGLRVFQRWQSSLSKGTIPEDGLTDGVLVLVGGVLLVTPGVLTDALGFACVFPPTRKVLATWLRAWAKAQMRNGTMTVVRTGNPASRRSTDVIETDGETVDVHVLD